MTDLVEKSGDGCHESVQNDYINGSMREDGLYKLTENVWRLLRDNLLTFFDPGIEPEDDTQWINVRPIILVLLQNFDSLMVSIIAFCVFLSVFS